MKRVAVLFSGRGSNLRAILEMAVNNPEHVSVVCVITDNIGALGIKHALDFGVPVILLSHPKSMSREAWERSITMALRGYDAHLVVLAGFMHILHEEFCKFWHRRCINIHPSILPSYPGLNTHRRVLADGVKWHGCTVHFVSPIVDGGQIIAQSSLEVFPDDTESSLAERVLKHEHILLASVILDICKGDITYREPY